METIYHGKTGPRYCGIFNYVITVCNVDHVIIGQLLPRGRQVDKEGKNDISASSTANEESSIMSQLSNGCIASSHNSSNKGRTSAGAELPHEFSSNVKRTGMLLWRLCHMTGSHLTSTPFTRLWINFSTSSEGWIYPHTGDLKASDVMKFENMLGSFTFPLAMDLIKCRIGVQITHEFFILFHIQDLVLPLGGNSLQILSHRC